MPAVVDFQRPPPAVPTYMFLGLLSSPSMAVMRPPMTAGPMWRASIWLKVEEVSLTWAATEKQLLKSKMKTGNFIF